MMQKLPKLSETATKYRRNPIDSQKVRRVTCLRQVSSVRKDMYDKIYILSYTVSCRTLRLVVHVSLRKISYIYSELSTGATMQIYVSNLPVKTTDKELKSMFEKFGTVKSAEIGVDKKTGAPM